MATVSSPNTTTPVIDLVPDNVGTPDINDISDIRIQRPESSVLQPMQLPIRGEKRFIPENPIALLGGGHLPSTEDFYIAAAKQTFSNYVVIRLPHRGLNPKTGMPDLTQTATYRFLINPQTAHVSRTTEDSQTFARGGWQFGVWGESLISISLTGHTPGYYWSYGLTDEFAYFTESWRNLQQLVMLFENNGYWFEGEESNEGPLAPNFTRRRIKKHQDVQLIVGDFIWYGMFDSLTVTLDADHPFRAEFSISFLAWKERYRQDSPYSQWGIQSNVQRGHAFGASSYPASETTLSAQKTGQLTILPLLMLNLLPGKVPPVSPAVASDQATQYLTGAQAGCSATPNSSLFSPSSLFG